MSLDDAIKQMTDLIKSACKDAEIKTVVMSDEEARLSVYAPAGEYRTDQGCHIPACHQHVEQ